MTRRRIAKLAGVQPVRLFDMPLAKQRAATGLLVFLSKGNAFLEIKNLEEPLLWKLALARTDKADPTAMAEEFNAQGSRSVNSLADGVDAAPVEKLPDDLPTLDDGSPAPGAAIDGTTEFGLQTDGDHEYFLSKFGDLVGVLRIQRKEDGSWKAGLAKSNVPRVLSPEAVEQGMMPPPGHSGLPKSLEAVVPAAYQYWKAQGDTARQMRDALVENSFFNDDCIKAVDGELRKVEVKFFLYDPTSSTEKRFAPPTLTSRVEKIVPESLLQDVTTPMSGNDGDWLEALDKSDRAGALAILSPPDRGATSPREMARAVKALKGEFLLEHNDTRFARACFRNVGVVFKIAGEPSRVFCSSFAPDGPVAFLKQGPVSVTDFQGLAVHIDRPKGFVQTGKDAEGNDWTREYQLDYGFLPRTKGGDGEELDVFIGPDATSRRVFWVTQNKADGTFDEYKLLVGFASPAEARAAYLDHVPEQYYAGMSEVGIEQIKALAGVDPVELAKRLAANAVRKINGVAYDEVRRAVQAALDEAYPGDDDTVPSPCTWIQDLYDDHAIYSSKGKDFQIGFKYANGSAQLSGEPVQVERVYKPVGDANTVPAQAPMATPTKALTKAMDTAVTELQKRELHIVGKAAPAQQYVLGIVLAPDEIDAQNDIYSADEVRKASERFMEMHRTMGLMHKQKVNDKVQILENYLAPTDMDIDGQLVKKGTWLMGVRVKDPTLWKAVQAGELTGFSIGGSAIRTPVAQGV